MMDATLRDLMGTCAFVYLDDVLVISPDMATHLKHLDVVLRRLQQHGLTVNLEKCRFAVSELKYLGHRITSTGVDKSSEKLAALIDFAPPARKRDVRKFLGLAQWFSSFVPHFFEVTAPLYELLQERVRWRWSAAENAALDAVKKAVAMAPPLSHVDFTKTLVCQTDASKKGAGVVVFYEEDNQRRVVEYASRKFSPAETRLPAY